MVYNEHTMMHTPAAPILQEADPMVSFFSHFLSQVSLSYCPREILLMSEVLLHSARVN